MTQKKLINVLLFLTPAVVFAFPGAYWVGSVIFAALGLKMLMCRQVGLVTLINLLQRTPMFWGFAIYVSLYIFLTIYHSEPAKDFGNILPFILAPLILLAIIQEEPDPAYFWYGCASGALLAFLIAVVQVYFFNVDRAFGFRNPITFGDTAILLGTGALVGLFFCQLKFKSNTTRIYLIIGGIAGLLTSLLSGSKGGWLSLIMVILLMANSAGRSLSFFKRCLIVTVILFLMTSLVAFVPKLPVVDRLVSAYEGTKVWIETGKVTEGSASIRLEAFKAGLIAGSHSPIFGLGRKGELEVVREAVEAGLVEEIMLEVNVIDNDFISTFSKQGLIGLFGIFAAHLGVILTFWRGRQLGLESTKALTTMGILLTVLYVEFGLSISIFGTAIFRTVYISWAVLLAGLLITQQRRYSYSE